MTRTPPRVLPALSALALILGALPPAAAEAQHSQTSATHAHHTAPAATQDWRPLFDGRSLAGWQSHTAPGQLPPGWEVVDGAITRTGPAKDLVTIEQFGSFELEFEWKVWPGANSGVFYRINSAKEVTYTSAPEYQVLDDAAHRDGTSRLTSAGAVYGLYPSPEGHTKPVGEWNAGRIVVRGNHVEHWLNGTKMAEYTLHSDDWTTRVNNSKFKAWPEYGQSARGPIGLQDHGDRVAFRNLRIRELPEPNS